MKGIILAGGLATRLRPLTLVTNKHLLPIYNKPMIFYPLEVMVQAGIKEVLLTTNAQHIKEFIDLLGNGDKFGIKLSYAVQNTPGGISDAISLGEKFAKKDNILVILGDNVFNYNLKRIINSFEKKNKGAILFGIHKRFNLNQYGIIEMKNNKVISVEEKPDNPKSNIVQTGVYLYDNRVFDFIRRLTPSERGELEVTDLNKFYVEEGSARCYLLPWWIDAGTSYDELLKANNLVKTKVRQKKL